LGLVPGLVASRRACRRGGWPWVDLAAGSGADPVDQGAPPGLV